MGLTAKMQKLAASFPSSIEEVKRGHRVIGVRNIHHYRKLLEFRKKYSTDYAEKYAEWFVPHHAKMIRKYPQHIVK